ncbi:hypothetical protein BDP55DRAFT_94574 [Colletotrichum godetiae]|uniref:Uncharacterized protein n=1 Tax=Colletotrichum godetiae TaxID=1209918 RepID=A0AAJ0ASZ8_9PEZI|nr:uncharacterized protein BDP55DRAFT_94574 [Colletotrichum godetiae]KAK1687559.1 hypothetical protein BDP55DRAFT_94574 [Colletotrichum godetiae]
MAGPLGMAMILILRETSAKTLLEKRSRKYLFFTTFPMVFMGQYGFSASFSGLTFIGVGIGTIFGTILLLIWIDRIAATLLLKEGVRRPGFRLPLMASSVPMIPVGLLLYG